MATYNYHVLVEELVQKHVIAARHVFLYSQHKLKYSYEQMFQFAQVNLSEVCQSQGYNIEPARFYYVDCSDVNACAIFDQGYYMIEINRGTFEQLFSLFCDTNDILFDKELTQYQTLNNILEADPHRVSLSYLIYQNATLFTYYHELGHLIQYANQINKVTGNPPTKSIQERYMAKTAATFDPIDHIVEYDADMHGANSAAFHIIDMWERLGADSTDENLKMLTVTSLVSIMGYITLLWGFGDLYYEEHSHPHPLIRIAWIMGTIVETVSARNSAMNKQELTSEALRMLDVYYQHLGQVNVKEKLIKPLAYYHHEITDYANKIIQNAKHVPYLAINTVHTRPFEGGTNTI